MNIASPKEKKRYFFSTAILYAFKITSLDENALTNIIRVDFGNENLLLKHLLP